MTEPTTVTFRSEGVELEALLFVPDGRGPFPAVVMAGGWCYVKELVQPQYAEVFRDAGLVSLIFDYRCFGGSGGEPRQHLDPWAQIEDYRNAISYLESRDDVDAARIAAWGISYSGGHALIVGGIDRRVRAVVSVVPVVEGLATMQRAHGTIGFRRFIAAIVESRRRRFVSGEHEYMKHSSEHPADELCTWPFPGSPPLFQMLKETQAPRYENRNTVASAEMLLQYSVAPYVAATRRHPDADGAGRQRRLHAVGPRDGRVQRHPLAAQTSNRHRRRESPRAVPRPGEARPGRRNLSRLPRDAPRR